MMPRLSVFALLLAACAQAWALECVPEFPDRGGWLGADAAYSVPLPSGKTVWLFGDTFVGGAGQTTRSGSKMIANSIAISSCDDGRGSVDYYWKRELFRSPRAFFDSGTDEYKLWPLDGFYYQGRLYVAFSQIRATPEGGPLGFEGIGVLLAEIDNPQEPPRHWTIRYRPLASGNAVFPGVSAVIRGEYVYLYAVLDGPAHKDHPMILTRVPLRLLDDPGAAIEYLNKSGGWTRGAAAEDAAVVMKDGATELSVRPGANGQWVAVQSKPEFGSDEIVARTAADPAGPWSAPRTVFRIPDMAQRRDVFCYAAKEQVQFRTSSGDAVLTYVCNALDPAKLTDDMEIYRPKAVLVKLP